MVTVDLIITTRKFGQCVVNLYEVQKTRCVVIVELSKILKIRVSSLKIRVSRLKIRDARLKIRVSRLVPSRPLETAIATVFLPTLLDASVEEIAKLRPILALPTRMGGLGIPDPTTTGELCHTASTASTKLLQESLVAGAPPLCYGAQARRLRGSPRGKGATAPGQ